MPGGPGGPDQAPAGPPAPATYIPPPKPVTKLAEYVANGPNGPCLALGPANPTPNVTITQWIATVNDPPCPATPTAAPLPVLDPVTIAEQFWRTIHLPAPNPTIPPGWAICGKPAYLVTNGSTAPAPYTEPTPLGTLTIDASGSYTVNWGDPTQPGTAGPYDQEGQPWPDGQIQHVYDNAGTYTVTVTETWTATWHLDGATGTLAGLHTGATIPGFQARQLEALEVS